MDSESLYWTHTFVQPKLEINDVHVWRVALDQPHSVLQTYLDTLTPDEHERAARFYFQRDREHFIVARGVLRSILGAYLDIPPSQICFCYSLYGKPSLILFSHKPSIRFNITHAHGLALLAFTRNREIGIDLEFIRHDFVPQEIAEHFFSPQEVNMLLALPARLRTRAFFNCWTRKEAYIKARGLGLSMPLNQFTVSLAPDEPAKLLKTNDIQETLHWSIEELPLNSDYVAAIAVEGREWKLSCWELNR